MDERRQQAARALAAGANQASVARELGVDRATIGRWRKDPEFQAYVASVSAEASEEAVSGLTILVPQALRLIERALSGEDVPATRARVALDVVKAAASIDKGSGGGSSAFEERLRELDARNK